MGLECRKKARRKAQSRFLHGILQCPTTLPRHVLLRSCPASVQAHTYEPGCCVGLATIICKLLSGTITPRRTYLGSPRHDKPVSHIHFDKRNRRGLERELNGSGRSKNAGVMCNPATTPESESARKACGSLIVICNGNTAHLWSARKLPPCKSTSNRQ